MLALPSTWSGWFQGEHQVYGLPVDPGTPLVLQSMKRQGQSRHAFMTNDRSVGLAAELYDGYVILLHWSDMPLELEYWKSDQKEGGDYLIRPGLQWWDWITRCRFFGRLGTYLSPRFRLNALPPNTLALVYGARGKVPDRRWQLAAADAFQSVTGFQRFAEYMTEARKNLSRYDSRVEEEAKRLAAVRAMQYEDSPGLGSLL